MQNLKIVQKQAIRNAVYGMTLIEALKFWQNAESDFDRKSMIQESILRYWPNDDIEWKLIPAHLNCFQEN